MMTPFTRCGLLMPDQPEELADAVIAGFAEHNCQMVPIYPKMEWNFQSCDFLLFYGPMRSIVRDIERLRTLPRVPPVLVWFTEQVPGRGWPGGLLPLGALARYEAERSLTSVLAGHIAGKAGRLRALGEMLTLQKRGLLAGIAVFTETNRRVLHRLGLPVALVPMGHQAVFGRDLHLERDIDVVFLGSAHDPRRGQMLAALESALAGRGVSFVIKDGSAARGYVFAEERIRLINRAKIMLNLMRQPWDDPVFRVLLAAPNRAMLLSETLLPTSRGPFEAGEHFAMSPDADIVGAICHYLAHDEERLRITENAHAFVTTELTMGQMAGRLMRMLS